MIYVNFFMELTETDSIVAMKNFPEEILFEYSVCVLVRSRAQIKWTKNMREIVENILLLESSCRSHDIIRCSVPVPSQLDLKCHKKQ